MKKLILFTGLILLVISVMAQKSWVGFTSDKAQVPEITVVDQNENQVILNISITGMYVEDVSEAGFNFQRIELIPFQTTKNIGQPELPILGEIIGIPGNKIANVEIMEQQTIKLNNYLIYPFQTPTTDNPGGHDKEFVMKEDFYKESIDYPGQQVYIDGMGIWRDVKIANLHIIPFNYNPAKKELIATTSIKVKITFSGEDSKMELNRSKSVSPVFYKMYQSTITNFESLGYTVNLRANSDIKYLIITNTGALSSIQPLVDWKNQQGYKVEVRTLEPGFEDPQDFKDYISELYVSDNLEYILMVGDAYPNGGSGGGENIVPMYWWSPGGDPSYSDSWYTCMDGGDDHYADLAIGRFTYDDLGELELQIQKTMDHYLAPDDNSDWAENSILIAHKEEYPGKYTACCEEIRNFNYAEQTPIFEQAYGGAGYSNEQVIDYVNTNSCGIFNYRGHGSATELWDWGSTGSFTVQHVNQLTNDDQLFVFFDVCCDNMDIVAHPGDCLCESFMKSPVASVAVNGAIIPSYTIPNHDYDKEMYKAVFNEGIYNIGYVTNYANITVLNLHGEIGMSNVRTYLWLGDASIEPWTLQPAELSVTHDQQLFLGLSTFSVTVMGNDGPAENALVCVTNEDQSIYGVAYTDASGIAEIVFDESVQIPGNVTVTASVHNHLPYQAIIPVIPQEGPYVVKDSFSLNDATGNNNGLMDYSETILLSLAVKNVGIETATNVSIVLSTDDTYITFTDDTEVYGDIGPDEIVEMTDAFTFDVADDIPDGHFVLVDVEATGDGDMVWNSSFSIEGHAPYLEIGSMTIDDSQGNGNGRLDPGEDAEIIIETFNNGSSDAMGTLGTISIPSSFVTVNNASHDFDVLTYGSMAEAVFSISVSAAAPIGTAISINYDVTSGEYSAQESFGASIGLILEDWETGDMTQYDWVTGGNGNWSVVNAGAYEGTYCAKSGVITHDQSTYLELEYDVLSDNVISFWLQVSSEANYDYLRFYIDGSEQGSWAGTVNWQEVEYPVTGGTHTFRWEYDKDYSVSNGSDCAWVDFIILPPSEMSTLAAGFISDITTLCEGESVSFEDASSGNVISWNWTFEGGSPGTSIEQNPIVTYAEAGSYDVTLEVSDGVETVSTTLENYITVFASPEQAAMPDGDIRICSNYVNDPDEYTTSGAANADSYVWELLPSEAGSISGNGLIAEVQWTEMWEGTATIKVKGVSDNCGEGEFSEELSVLCNICTSIDKQVLNKSINIFPNPTTGQFTIEFNLETGQTEVQVMDVIGEVIFERELDVTANSALNVDLGRMRKGLYFAKVKSGNAEIIRKIVVK